MQTYFLETKEKREYRFDEHTIQLEIDKDTFPPSQWASLVINNLTVGKGDKVLDIGTGVGIIGIYAAKLGAKVWGTDISPAAIEQAKSNAYLNNVQAEFRVGPYFASFDETFDVITANLPQEIIPDQYPVDPNLLSTISGGSKGNEVVMGLLQEAHQYMSQQTKLILPISSLSFYLETMEYISQRYEVRLRGVYSVCAKEYVKQYEEVYNGLNTWGKIRIFKEQHQWKHLLYIVELKIK